MFDVRIRENYAERIESKDVAPAAVEPERQKSLARSCPRGLAEAGNSQSQLYHVLTTRTHVKYPHEAWHTAATKAPIHLNGYEALAPAWPGRRALSETTLSCSIFYTLTCAQDHIASTQGSAIRLGRCTVYQLDDWGRTPACVGASILSKQQRLK